MKNIRCAATPYTPPRNESSEVLILIFILLFILFLILLLLLILLFLKEWRPRENRYEKEKEQE